jgi:hypothetical protein
VTDRARREPDPLLDWKLRIFFGGAVLLAVGVVFDREVLLLVAILLLLVGGFATAILSKRHRRAAEAAEDVEAQEVADQGHREDEPPSEGPGKS